MDILILIISLIFTMISMFLSTINYEKIKFKLKNFLIYFILMFPMFFIINIFVNSIFKIILIVLSLTISFYFSIFNKKMESSLYYSILYELFACIGEIILSLFFVSMTNLNMNDNSMILMLIFSILNSILIYVISFIPVLKKIVNKFKNMILNKIKEIVYIIIIFLLIIFLLKFNMINFNKDLSFYINSGMTIFVVITFAYIIKKDFQNDKLENNYNEMMEYVQKYEKIINEQGKKNHEYNNQLTVIRGYSHNPKKLEEYLDTIIEDHKCGQNYTIRQLSNFPDGGIKGLIYHKLGKMEDNNIKYYLYIGGESKNIFEEKFDLKTYQDITKLLGVFLDNAIDASKEAKEKEIELDIKNEDNCIIITISNTFNSKVDTKQIGKKGFTTKGKGHGYGLSIVKDINKHNENIETFNDIEDDKFTQTILIYYK